MHSCIFFLFVVLRFHICNIKLKLIGLTSNISTCCGKSDGSVICSKMSKDILKIQELQSE